MKRVHIYLIGVALASLIGTGCDLNLDPLSDQSELNLGSQDTDSTRVKYKDRDAMKAVYETLYTTMRDRQEHWYVDYLLFGEARTDNAYGGTTGAEVVSVETNALDASTKGVTRDWDRYLEDIAIANTIITNIDLVPDSSFTQAERAQWKAEAKIFRGMMLFDLAHWYGNVPLNLTEAPDITADNIEEVYPIYFPTPVTQDSAYKQVIADLTEAIPYAPAVDKADKSRLSKTVAYALLAKLYAEFGDWYKVVEYCDLVLADGITLEPEYADLWAYVPGSGEQGSGGNAKLRNSQETILEVQYPNPAEGNWCTWMFGRDLYNWDNSFTWAKWITPSRDIIAAFEAEGDTLRMNQTIVYYECGWSNYYPSDHYPFMYKCRSAGNSIIKLRGADLMLLKAEALAHQGNLSDAAVLVNNIRHRAKLGDLAATAQGSQEAMLDAILHERRLELALEGQRFFDLVRFGKLVEVMNTINSRDEGRLPQARPFVEAHRLLPIPQTAIDQNTNLKQNTGY